LFSLGGAALFAFAGFISVIEDYTDVVETQAADAIVVLGAGVEKDGNPSDATQARIAHGVRLYEAGYAPLIAVTGGERVGPPAEARIMAERALAVGVPQEALIVEDDSLNTNQNAEYVAPLLREHGVETILLVTSPFHQWRAERVFEEAGFEVYLSPPPDDPAEERPVRRIYYLTREGAVALVYLLFAP
jgi:uncharacterized SAM-binding protein YcdF (DUF218 family)